MIFYTQDGNKIELPNWVDKNYYLKKGFSLNPPIAESIEEEKPEVKTEETKKTRKKKLKEGADNDII